MKKLKTYSTKKEILDFNDLSKNISLNSRNNEIINDSQNGFDVELNLDIPNFALEFIKGSKVQINYKNNAEERQLFTFEKDGKVMFGKFTSSYIRKYPDYISLTGGIEFFHKNPLDKTNGNFQYMVDIGYEITELPASKSFKVFIDSLISKEEVIPKLVMKDNEEHWMILSNPFQEPIYIKRSEGIPIVLNGHMNVKDKTLLQNQSLKYLLLKKDNFEVNNIIDGQVFSTISEYPQGLYLLTKENLNHYFYEIENKVSNNSYYTTSSFFIQLILPEVDIEKSKILFDIEYKYDDILKGISLNTKIREIVDTTNSEFNSNKFRTGIGGITKTPYTHQGYSLFIKKNSINDTEESKEKYYIERIDNLQYTNRYNIELENFEYNIDINKNLFLQKKTFDKNKLLFYPQDQKKQLLLFENKTFFEKNIFHKNSKPYIFPNLEEIVEAFDNLGTNESSFLVQTSKYANEEYKKLYFITDKRAQYFKSNKQDQEQDDEQSSKNKNINIQIIEEGNSENIVDFLEKFKELKTLHPFFLDNQIKYFKTNENLYLFTKTTKLLSTNEQQNNDTFIKLPIKNNIIELPLFFVTNEQKTKAKLLKDNLGKIRTSINPTTNEMEAVLDDQKLNKFVLNIDVSDSNNFEIISISINGIDIDKKYTQNIISMLKKDKKDYSTFSSSFSEFEIEFFKVKNEQEMNLLFTNYGKQMEIFKKENNTTFISNEKSSSFYKEIKNILKKDEKILGNFYHEKLDVNILYTKNRIIIYKNDDNFKDSKEIQTNNPYNACIFPLSLIKTYEMKDSILNNSKNTEFKINNDDIVFIEIEDGKIQSFDKTEIERIFKENLKKIDEEFKLVF